MKTNDEGINRRNIPVNFMDYIAQKHGYETFAKVPAKKITKVSEDIKHMFSQTEVNTRIAYGRSMIKVKRLPRETALDFVKRVDHLRYHPEVTETRISGTVPGDKVLTGCPFDEPLPPIPGDAETLGLSNLSPELVKKVAAELLELEKTSKYSVHDEYIYEADDANRRRIERLINLSLNYATPIFDLKTLNGSVADVNIAMKKWRKAFDALFNDPTTIARRYGQKILNAVPKKHAFAKSGFISEEDSFKMWVKTGDSEKLSESDGTRYWWPIPEPRYDTPGNNPETKEAQTRISGFGWDRIEVVNDPFPRKKYFRGDLEVFPEIGPEPVIDRAGRTRTAPSDLKIETNQQWSPEELKEWLAKPEQQRKPYVFREDRAQPGNTAQQRKPYREPIMAAASNDGVNWEAIAQQINRGIGNYGFDPGRNGSDKSVYAVVSKDEVRIRNYAPDNWPTAAPPYHSAEGWEFEKAMKLRNLKSMLTIEWLEKQQTEKHALVAQRLREILAA